MDKQIIHIDIPCEWGIKPKGSLKAALHNLMSAAERKGKGWLKSKRYDEFIETEYLDGTREIIFSMQKGKNAGELEPCDGSKFIRRMKA